MKKTLLLIAILMCVDLSFAQTGRFSRQLSAKKDIALTRHASFAGNERASQAGSLPKSLMAPTTAPNEVIIGNTRYDLMTNQAVQNRIYRYDDGSIGAIWTIGFSETTFPDRGTGYNFFDGTSWGPSPTLRIETNRCGFASYAPLGPGGEIVVSHNGTDGLEICKRPGKGAGMWTQTHQNGPAGHFDVDWPRMVTAGPDHSKIHIFSIVAPVANGGTLYNGQDGAPVYSRSQDAGVTWDKLNVTLPGTDINFYNAFGGDAYAFAEPKGDTLAFVMGDNWSDVFLLKSVDGGDNWTKTIIFAHPYQHFKETSTLVLDTPWVCDGSIAIALDNEGKANVFFGLMRALNDDTTDAGTSYFPYTDGLAFWKEGQPPFTDLHADSVYARNNLVGWMQDWNGNDTTIGDLIDIGTYELSLTSMPNVTIDGSGNIFLLMSSLMDVLDNGSQNYRHLLARASYNGGETWTDFIDVTGGLTHNFHECVFPAIAATSDDNIHYMYMADEEPGLAVRGDEDPYGDNMMYYARVPKSDFCSIDAAFTASADSVNLNVSGDVSFTDGSTGNIVTWNWDFGDGGTSNIQNPSHTYATEGTFTVTLTISDGACTDIFTRAVVAYRPGGLNMFENLSSVSQNYPNPFTGKTFVEVYLDRPADLVLEIYDLIGQKVYADKIMAARGLSTFSIDGKGLNGGVYFYTVTAGNDKVTRKMTVK